MIHAFKEIYEIKNEANIYTIKWDPGFLRLILYTPSSQDTHF